MISSLGLYLLYKSGIGSTPLATISDGLSRVIGTTRGNANIVTNVSLLIVAVVLNRSGLGKGTLITVFGIGIFINMWTTLLGEIVIETRWQYQYIYSILGMLFNAFGLSYYVRINAGFGPLEYITEVFVKRSGKSYRLVKTCIDITLLMIGIMLGGVYGFGTILNVTLTGICMSFFINHDVNKEDINNEKN